MEEIKHSLTDKQKIGIWSSNNIDAYHIYTNDEKTQVLSDIYHIQEISTNKAYIWSSDRKSVAIVYQGSRRVEYFVRDLNPINNSTVRYIVPVETLIFVSTHKTTADYAGFEAVTACNNSQIVLNRKGGYDSGGSTTVAPAWHSNTTNEKMGVYAVYICTQAWYDANKNTIFNNNNDIWAGQ